MTITLPNPTVTQQAHACRWCASTTCTDRFDHDRLFTGGDTYPRMSEAQRNTCPACRGDVRNGACPAPFVVRCEYCGDPMNGLLDACGKPDCIEQDIAFAASMDRWADQ